MYAARDLRLQPHMDGLSLDGKISMRTKQVHFEDTDDEQVKLDHERITMEQMIYT